MARWTEEDRTPLAQLRARAGYSMEKAAVLMGITGRTLARYENAVNDIPLGTAENMAVLYHVPFNEFRQAAKETKEIASKKKHKE